MSLSIVVKPFDFCFPAAAEDLRSNRRAFEQNVRLSMRGGLHKGISYDNVIA